METTFDLPKSMANGFFYVGLGIGTWAVAQLVAWGVSSLHRRRKALAESRDSWSALAQELASGIRPRAIPIASQNSSDPQQPVAWLGWRSFVVERIEREAAETVSIYLLPEDGQPLPAYLPGQFVTLAVTIPGESRPLVRCYSLSDRWQANGYRITVKEAPREFACPAVAGGRNKVRVSRYLCKALKAGATLQLKAPNGQFALNMQSNRPVVLLGAGIGVTPLVSMLQSIAVAQSQRKAVALLQFRNSELAPFRRELAELSKQQTNIQLVQAYSAPLPTDREGTDFDLRRRITPELLRQLLPHNQFEFYVCGPAEFMQTMVAGLEAWGVLAADIHYEAFGPASFKRMVLSSTPSAENLPGDPAADVTSGTAAPKHLVQFQNTGTGIEWDEKFDSLLSLLESCDIPVESGCRAGNCGTCALALHSGKVRYTEQPAASLSPGECLPCVCVPEGPLVLRA